MARIHVYAVNCNERELMPLFMSHYRDFVRAEKISVHYDDSSTDGSEQLARELGAEIVHHERARSAAGEVALDDNYLRDLRSTFWHPSRGQADWIIVVDIDELIIHPQLHKLLDSAPPEVQVLQPQGWELVGDWPPAGKQAWQAVRRGIPQPYCSKPCVFRPSINMQFAIGSHDATPMRDGKIVPIHEAPQLKLLHCSYLGLDYLLRRYAMRRARAMSDMNQKMGWGAHWRSSDDELRRRWDEVNRDAVDIPDLPR